MGSGYQARLSGTPKTFKKVLRTESLVDSEKACQPFEAQNLSRAPMNLLSKVILFSSRSDRIAPRQPPSPLKAMLHKAA